MSDSPTIPDDDLGFDVISYAREIVSDPSHHDADEFSACARETLAAMLAAWDRLSEGHNTLFRNHAFLMATKIPPTVISIPAPPADAATEAVRLRAEDVEWVVNSIAELGVKIGDQFFFLYKGESLVYTEGEDDEPPLMWRHVGKREFGECCHPINDADPTKYGTVDVNDGRKWRPLLSTPAPAPSTKEDTIEHPCGCYAPDGDVCLRHAAPSTHALLAVKQEVKP